MPDGKQEVTGATRSAARLRLWSERPIPAWALHLLDERVVLTGTATDIEGDPLASLPGADAIIASARVRYNAALFKLVPSLRVIARTGAGWDNIDLAEATRRGVVVCVVPDGPTMSAAEHTIALLLAVAKRLKSAEVALLSGRFDLFNEHEAMELERRTLGIVGLGRIGSRVAAIANGFGMRVVAFDPFLPDGRENAAGVELVESLDELLGRSDAVTLHLPLTMQTRHVINQATLALMHPGAILINTARGGLVDEAALVDALESGHLSGAGLDVLDPEPPSLANPLLGRLDVVVTPHIAAATGAARARLWEGAIKQVLDVLAGRRPLHPLNPEALVGAGASAATEPPS